jgi:hypothetical protein
MRIWNEGTRAFKQISSEFSKIDFNEVHGIVKSMPISDRGNIVGCYGFSQQNSKGELDLETCMNKPQPKEGNAQVIPIMVVLSKLGVITETIKGDPKSPRMQDFSGRLHTQNLLEGLTLGMTDRGMAETVFAHVDQYNCHDKEHNHLVIASSVGLVERKIKRLAIIGYGRKSIGDFMIRKAKFKPILQLVKKCMNELEDHQLFYGRDRVTIKPVVSIINGCTLVFKANIDKRSNTSSFVDPFIKLQEQFHLSIQQSIEVMIPIGWGTETYMYGCTLMSWGKSGKLPSGNLTLAYASDCLQHSLHGFSFVPKSRDQPKCGKPFSMERAINGASIIENIIQLCESKKELLDL